MAPPDISVRVIFLHAAAMSLSEPLPTTSAYIRASHDRLRSAIGELGITELVVACPHCGGLLGSEAQDGASSDSSPVGSRASRRQLMARKLAKSEMPETSVLRPKITKRCDRCRRLTHVQDLHDRKISSKSIASRSQAILREERSPHSVISNRAASNPQARSPTNSKSRASNQKQHSLQLMLARSKHISSTIDKPNLGLMDFMKIG